MYAVSIKNITFIFVIIINWILPFNLNTNDGNCY